MLSLLDSSASGPAWRAVRAEMDSSTLIDGSIPRSFDPLVRRYRAYRDFLRKGVRPCAAVRWLNGPMGIVDAIHERVHPGCTRHAIEAAAMARADYAYYQEHIHPALTPEIVDLYCALFFDVKEHLGCRWWIEAHVMGPANETSDDQLRRSGYSWKLHGWSGGTRRLLIEGMRGIAYSKEDFEWVTSLAATETARHVLNRAHSSDRLLMEAGASMDAGIAKSWLEARTKESENSNALENSPLDDIAKAVSGQFIMMTPGNETEAEERFDGTVKTY